MFKMITKEHRPKERMNKKGYTILTLSTFKGDKYPLNG